MAIQELAAMIGVKLSPQRKSINKMVEDIDKQEQQRADINVIEEK